MTLNKEFYNLLEELVGEDIHPSTIQSKQYKEYYVLKYPNGKVEITTKNPIQVDTDIYVISPQALMDPLDRQDILVFSYQPEYGDIIIPRNKQEHVQQKVNMGSTVLEYFSKNYMEMRSLTQKNNILRIKYKNYNEEVVDFGNFLIKLVDTPKDSVINLFNNRYYVEYQDFHCKFIIYDRTLNIDGVQDTIIYSYDCSKPEDEKEYYAVNLNELDEETRALINYIQTNYREED